MAITRSRVQRASTRASTVAAIRLSVRYGSFIPFTKSKRPSARDRVAKSLLTKGLETKGIRPMQPLALQGSLSLGRAVLSRDASPVPTDGDASLEPDLEGNDETVAGGHRRPEATVDGVAIAPRRGIESVHIEQHSLGHGGVPPTPQLPRAVEPSVQTRQQIHREDRQREAPLGPERRPPIELYIQRWLPRPCAGVSCRNLA